MGNLSTSTGLYHLYKKSHKTLSNVPHFSFLFIGSIDLQTTDNPNRNLKQYKVPDYCDYITVDCCRPDSSFVYFVKTCIRSHYLLSRVRWYHVRCNCRNKPDWANSLILLIYLITLLYQNIDNPQETPGGTQDCFW